LGKKTILFNVDEQCNRNLIHPLNSFWVTHPRRSF